METGCIVICFMTQPSNTYTFIFIQQFISYKRLEEQIENVYNNLFPSVNAHYPSFYKSFKFLLAIV